MPWFSNLIPYRLATAIIIASTIANKVTVTSPASSQTSPSPTTQATTASRRINCKILGTDHPRAIAHSLPPLLYFKTMIQTGDKAIIRFGWHYPASLPTNTPSTDYWS